MKLINRETDYAMRALTFMAEHNQKEARVSVTEMVEALKIPRPFLRKILQILHKKGLLKSYKGIGGGFQLAHLPSKIFLVDLIQIFQGPVSLNECIIKKNICPDTLTCVLRKKINEIEKRVITDLKSITIESLLNGV